jgi:hypothetical protein
LLPPDGTAEEAAEKLTLPAWAASAAKGAIENRGFIAAVKRCATRNQNIKIEFFRNL